MSRWKQGSGYMAKGIKKDLYKAIENANQDIVNFAKRGGPYAGALSPEGYSGGYRDALNDVLSALNGHQNLNSRFWPKELRG